MLSLQLLELFILWYFLVFGIFDFRSKLLVAGILPNLHCNVLNSYMKQSWWLLNAPHYSGLGKNTCCSRQHFLVKNMQSCHPWLTCSDLQSIKIKELIGYGAIKAVYRAEWNGIELAFSILNNKEYKNDFLHGVNMLQLLNPSPYVVQLIGHCRDDNVILTEYHKLGSAVHVTDILETVMDDSILSRLRLCLNYAEILQYLHNSPAGKRVFCDSNSLDKLLSQLLVKSDGSLVINDVDALPEVNQENNFAIACGHIMISGSFVPPEQLWPFGDINFDDSKMPRYDEKTDIWKAVAVCEHFIGTITNGDVARYHIFDLHKKCRNLDPRKRPSARNLVEEYSKMIEDIGKSF